MFKSLVNNCSQGFLMIYTEGYGFTPLQTLPYLDDDEANESLERYRF